MWHGYTGGNQRNMLVMTCCRKSSVKYTMCDVRTTGFNSQQEQRFLSAPQLPKPHLGSTKLIQYVPAVCSVSAEDVTSSVVLSTEIPFLFFKSLILLLVIG